MINLRENAKVKIHWKVNSCVYNREMENEIISAFSNKYSIPKNRITVVPELYVENGRDESDAITRLTTDNIQDPNFQKSLFMKYLEMNKINDYNWDFINSLDNEINEKINYAIYEKYRKFSIKWIEWSNFMSYGEGNSFHFSNLNGLVLLNGEPANRSGKTVFAVDLLHFLLFGKPGRRKCLDELFNVMLPEATQVVVEGCLNIEGQDYIIKRVLKRPSLEKRTGKVKASQKVEYYRMTNDVLEELSEYEQMNGESSVQTNKIIKECIGREEDFDLMMCITGTNIDELTSKGAAEKGRLFLAWTGLLPLEEKYNIANSMFLDYSKKLKSNSYNREDLKNEIESFTASIDESNKRIKEIDNEISEINSSISGYEAKKETLLSQKDKIDEEILKLDIDLSEKNLEKKKNEGIRKKGEYDSINNELSRIKSEIGDITFNFSQYSALNEKKNELSVKLGSIKLEIETTKKMITSLRNSEYCPFCKRKMDNVDNTEKIKENEDKINELSLQEKDCSDSIAKITEELNTMVALNAKIKERDTKANTLIAIANELSRYKDEYTQILENIKKYNANRDSIEKNKKIDADVNVLNVNIVTNRDLKEKKIMERTQLEEWITSNKKNIAKNEELIKEIDNEIFETRNYRIYLDMLGKNGISKIILKEVLPIINGRIKQKLDGVCDFDINVDMNHRDEVMFNITSNGVTNDISSGSGFEKTVTALVIRNVLAEISTIPKMNFIIFDEILGRVASENYDKIKLLYDRILSDYDFIFHITHNEDILDWHNQIVTVVKDSNGCSKLKDIVDVDIANRDIIKKKANSVKK